MSCFVDTSALYAFLVRSDADHPRIADAFRSLLEGGRRLVTTSYVLVESSALLQHRIGLDPVRDLDARIAPVLDTVWISADLHRRGLARLFQLDRRQVSLVDAISFTVMEEEGLRDVLGLDPDFVAAGFRLLP